MFRSPLVQSPPPVLVHFQTAVTIVRTKDREPREIHTEKALFLFKRMYFLEAVAEFKKALSFPEKKDNTGVTTDDGLIRNYLRNLYILIGAYDKAIEENNWFLVLVKAGGGFD
ncbi:MAG: hypothetical protein WCK00_05345, partial [Deltaproteobacteria bacterium]